MGATLVERRGLFQSWGWEGEMEGSLLVMSLHDPQPQEQALGGVL